MVQFRVLLEIAHGHRLYSLLILAATAGLRRAELVGLRWADVDLASGTLRVTAPPKLGQADLPHVRLVAITERAATALMRWRERQTRERLARRPFGDDSSYVFTDLDGRPYRPAYLARAVRSLMRRAGIHPANLHSLRAFAINRYAASHVQRGSA